MALAQAVAALPASRRQPHVEALVLRVVRELTEVCNARYMSRADPLIITRVPRISRLWTMARHFFSPESQRRLVVIPTDAELVSVIERYVPPGCVPVQLRRRALLRFVRSLFTLEGLQAYVRVQERRAHELAVGAMQSAVQQVEERRQIADEAIASHRREAERAAERARRRAPGGGARLFARARARARAPSRACSHARMVGRKGSGFGALR